MRNLNTIARDISKDWTNISPYAKPYLEAMHSLWSIDDRYILDSADEIVRRFLANATGWRGENARTIKKELRSMLR